MNKGYYYADMGLMEEKHGNEIVRFTEPPI